MLKLKDLTLDAVPETLKSLFSVDAEGELQLDETKVKTLTDVENLKRDKDKERDAANQARAELAKFKEIGTVEDIKTRLEAKDSEKDERLAQLQRDLRKSNSDRDAYKEELDKIKPDYENLKTETRQRKTSDVLSEFVGKLKGVDAPRLTRALKKDIALGLIELDESGDGLKCKDGSDISQYAQDVAKDFGFLVDSTAGESKTTESITQNQINRTNDNKGGLPVDNTDMFEDDVMKQLKL